MKAGSNESSKKLVSGWALAVWLLLPLVVLVVLKTDCLPQVTVRQLFAQFSFTQPAGDGSVNKVPSSGTENATQQEAVGVARLKAAHDPVVGAPPPTALSNETAAGGADANGDLKNQTELLAMNGERDGFGVNSDVAAPRSRLSCNFSFYRMNICAMEGDVRTHGKAGTVYVVSASDDSYRPENGTVTIRPYPRKWEKPTMQLAREVTIRSSGPGAADTAPPRCTVTHDVPAVVFSTGGYSSNFFHAVTDIVIPLYNTAREYDGRVQLVVTDYSRKWIAKYRHVLATLSAYPVIDFDADDDVRCFPKVHVGIESHKELGINPVLSHRGYTLMDFRDFLRSAYSLKRAWSTPIIPWGEMKWPCWSIFGETVPDMGLRYVEYEATAEETTLKDVYPRDHPVFTNPVSIHKQGFDQLWKIFLDGQNVTLDINRFRGFMQQIYQDVTVT
ncbi:unnamed protein product [Triticum turgidum subsp. durum]|uniref:Uncharacterized protein n=1 Tax=Triticum turgidum subsp. durum TaxID=4567 RepID=A0A9R0Z985_TRITD|nr:unnamed protein product [Triticum turgidum subsp. durum]